MSPAGLDSELLIGMKAGDSSGSWVPRASSSVNAKPMLNLTGLVELAP